MSKLFFLADDDLDDQDMFLEAVKSLDKTNDVISAFDGDEAMRMLSGNLPSLPDYIFLDLNMPKLNGKQCLERIKQQSDLKDIPVIIYTTSNLDRDMEETLAMGATRFLTKPSRFNELQRALAEITGAKMPAQR